MSTNDREALLQLAVLDYLADPTFMPVLAPASMRAFHAEVARVLAERELSSSNTIEEGVHSEHGEGADPEESGEGVAADMPTLQESMAAYQRERARKQAGSTRQGSKISGTKRALVESTSGSDSGYEQVDGESDEERQIVKAKPTIRVRQEQGMGIPKQSTGAKELNADSGLIPQATNSKSKQDQAEQALAEWRRKQQPTDLLGAAKLPRALDEPIQMGTLRMNNTDEVIADMAEQVGSRIESRNKPTEWKSSTIDDQVAWREFYDKFKCHILQKGKEHPRAYIPPKHIRNLQFLMRRVRSLSAWENLGANDWLEGVNTVLTQHYGWAVTVEEVTLATEDMAPLWEDFMEKCQSMINTTALPDKEKKKKVVDAIQKGGYTHESMVLRELVENEEIDFPNFLQPVAELLGTLDTIAKRLRKSTALAQDFKRRRTEGAGSVLAVMDHTKPSPSGPSNNTSRCNRCNKIGHWARDCRSKLSHYQQGYQAREGPRQQSNGGRGYRREFRPPMGRDFRPPMGREKNVVNQGNQMNPVATVRNAGGLSHQGRSSTNGLTPRQSRPVVAFTGDNNSNNSGDNFNTCVNCCGHSNDNYNNNLGNA